MLLVKLFIGASVIIVLVIVWSLCAASSQQSRWEEHLSRFDGEEKKDL
jgi:hypothetical protein